MFRNLRLYKVTSDWPDNEADLSALLQASAFEPCGSLSERSVGWEPPAAELPDLLARRVGGADLLRLRHQSRILPPAAVREALELRVAELEARNGEPLTSRDKRELKEDITSRLLPQALLKSDRIDGFFLVREGLLGIATATPANAERFMDCLRVALGSLAATPLAFPRPTSELLTSVFLGVGPKSFHAGRECRMKDPTEPTTQVNWLQVDLADTTVRRHVRDGYSVERLGIQYEGVIECVLDGDTVFRKIKLPGIGEASDDPEESALAKQDADFALCVSAVSALVAGLRGALTSDD